MKINKAEFSHMLKKVQDQVLKARNIVQAFSASGTVVDKQSPLIFWTSFPEGGSDPDQQETI